LPNSNCSSICAPDSGSTWPQHGGAFVSSGFPQTPSAGCSCSFICRTRSRSWSLSEAGCDSLSIANNLRGTAPFSTCHRAYFTWGTCWIRAFAISGAHSFKALRLMPSWTAATGVTVSPYSYIIPRSVASSSIFCGTHDQPRDAINDRALKLIHRIRFLDYQYEMGNRSSCLSKQHDHRSNSNQQRLHFIFIFLFLGRLLSLPLLSNLFQ